MSEAEVHRRVGSGLEWAAAQARIAIHEQRHEQLQSLLKEYPALISWRDESDQTLMDATTSYAMDCLDPERERTYTRPVAAEMLIDEGASVDEKTWMHVIKTGASGMLNLFARKNVLPRSLNVFAALGDDEGVRSQLTARSKTGDSESDFSSDAIGQALLIACRFQHSSIAEMLLERAIVLDSELGRCINRWKDPQAFIEFLLQQRGLLWQDSVMTPWQTFVILQLADARDRADLPAFREWLRNEPWVLEGKCMGAQSTLLFPACYQKNRGAFIKAVFELDAAILHADTPPQTSHIVQALSYGNAELVPLLTRVWPLPDDLPHAAGVGDMVAVAKWFDANGRPDLKSLSQHYPTNDPNFPRSDLHWGPPTAQQTLDIALAWAILNLHFEIAEFLLERGANINTDWGTHEPASILHEAAIQGNQEAARFLLSHGADLDQIDFRYQSTAEGWARYGANDEAMAELLAAARTSRSGNSAS